MPFIPLHDANPLRHIHHAWVTWLLIAANCVVFLLNSGDIEAVHGAAIRFGLIPAVFNGGYSLPADYQTIPDGLTLLTYAFLHGDIWHLAGNMVFLWVFADNIEDSLGHLRFLAFYCLSAAGAGYAQVLAFPASDIPVIGASGAVAGVVGAYFVLHPYVKVWILAFGRIPLRFASAWIIGFWAVFQVFEVATSTEGEIAWWTHIGGFLTGALLVVFFRRKGVALFDRAPVFIPVATERVDEAATGGIGSAAPPKSKGSWE
jgi:membrane associated rhomboid family serine protease